VCTDADLFITNLERKHRLLVLRHTRRPLFEELAVFGVEAEAKPGDLLFQRFYKRGLCFCGAV
jgi:hypothetical protein